VELLPYYSTILVWRQHAGCRKNGRVNDVFDSANLSDYNLYDIFLLIHVGSLGRDDGFLASSWA
jgi:hypothetical protein